MPSNSYSNPNDYVYYGEQFMVMNECLMRNKNRARYTAFIDVDELIWFDRFNHNYSFVEYLTRKVFTGDIGWEFIVSM